MDCHAFLYGRIGRRHELGKAWPEKMQSSTNRMLREIGEYVHLRDEEAWAEDCFWFWNTWSTPFGQGLSPRSLGMRIRYHA